MPSSLEIFFFFFKYFYLFLAVVGLHCCVGFSVVVVSRGAYSSCGARASHCSGFSCCRAWALGYKGFSSRGAWAY